jgi:leucyl/phenylalanyl-tRNA--protein transferase
MKTIEEIILDSYREGIFPMAESAEDESFAFYKPYQRGLIPIADLHIPAKLLKTIRRKKFQITRNYAFRQVIDRCATATPKRGKTWINRPIRDIFLALHREGHAHSIECWNEDRQLAGGLYGLAIGSVFCGESMFSSETDASKVALVALCALLWKSGFTMLDTQFINPHLLQFGAYEIPQDVYEERIATEMSADIAFAPEDPQSVLEEYLRFRGL